MRLFQKKKTAPAETNPDMRRLATLLAHHKITSVFDIGANIGQTAQRYREAGFEGKIISFEPLSNNHKKLCKLAARDAKWQIAPRMAVGQCEEEIAINISQNHDMSSALHVNETMLAALPKSKIVETESVSVKTIDSFIGDYTAANENVFVKVDTQGYEQNVIRGAVKSMKQDRIKGWQLELSFLPLYDNEPTFETIVSDMKAYGYEPYFAMPGFFSKKLMRQLQMDIIFFRS